MSEVNLFELASIEQWRFKSAKGELSVEDLYQIPLARGALNLDAVTIAAAKEAEASKTESYVTKPRPGSKQLAQKLELLKYIITFRIALVDTAKKAATKKDLKQKIAAAREANSDNALSKMSPEELDAYEASLDA